MNSTINNEVATGDSVTAVLATMRPRPAGPPGERFLTDDQRAVAKAKVLVDGAVGSAALMHTFGNPGGTDAELQRLREWVYEAAKDVKAGDLGRAETILIAQALALDSVFTNFARRAAGAEYLDQLERFMRVALKAQNQCRMTLETLAMVKNPPNATFIRQANLANGPQQVNNYARAGVQTESEQNEVLGEAHGQRMDTRAQSTATRSDPALEAVGAINRPANRGRKAARLPKSVEGRPKAKRT